MTKDRTLWWRSITATITRQREEREREKDAMFYEVPMRSIEGLSAADGDGGAQTMRLPAAWESIHRGACATGNI